MVTSLPGMTLRILISLPSRNFCTLSLFIASSSTSSSLASAATSILARTLPLTWITISMELRTSALSSSSGHWASIIGSLLPSMAHSVWHMWGDADVKLMQQAGLYRVFIGAESGSDDVLRSANKVRFQAQHVLFDVAAKLHEAGITCTFSLIFALPGETDLDRRATLAMIREMKSRFPSTEFHSNIYTPYPGAPNFQLAVEMGVREPESLKEWAEFYPKFQRLPWLNESDHRHIQRMREYIRIGFGAHRIRRRSSLRERIVRLLEPAARARLKADLYSVPVELWFLKSAARLRARLTTVRERSHVLQS